jgi:hypothetical protein
MNDDEKQLQRSGFAAAAGRMPPWAWVGIGLAALVILVAVRRWRKTPPPGEPRAEGVDEYGEPLTLEQYAAEISAKYFTQHASCSIAWVSTGSSTALSGHVEFFRRAVLASGATNLEAQTNYVYGLLNRGCTKPHLLAGYDIDRALAGTLDVAQSAGWIFVRGDSTVQLYLAVRAMVAAVQAS